MRRALHAIAAAICLLCCGAFFAATWEYLTAYGNASQPQALAYRPEPGTAGKALTALVAVSLRDRPSPALPDTAPPDTFPSAAPAAVATATPPGASSPDEPILFPGLGGALGSIIVSGISQLPASRLPPATPSAAPSGAALQQVGEIVARIEKDQTSVALSLEMNAAMTLRERYDVTLLVERQPEGEEAAPASLMSMQRSFSQPTLFEDRFQVSDQMRATLVGGDFDISELRGGWQSVVVGITSVWHWSVIPKVNGKRQLLLSVDAGIGAGQSMAAVPVRNYPREIEVVVSGLDWISNVGLWGQSMVGSIIFGACTLISGAVGLTQLHSFATQRKRPAGDPKEAEALPRSQRKPPRQTKA